MKFLPRYRTKKLGIIYTIFGSFYSFLNWEGADIRSQIRPRKISDECHCDKDHVVACADPYMPRREKTCLQGFANNTGADQTAQSDQRLCYLHFRKYHIQA